MTHGIRKPRFSRENGVFCWLENGTVSSQAIVLKLLTAQKELCGDFYIGIIRFSGYHLNFHVIHLANYNLSAIICQEKTRLGFIQNCIMTCQKISLNA